MKKIGLVLFIFSFCNFTYAQDETLTLLTYYPAPYGVYNALKVGTTEADVAGITAPLQVGGASPVDTSIYAEQNGGGEAAAGYAGYFINNVVTGVSIYSSGLFGGIEATSSTGDGGFGGRFTNTETQPGTNYGVWASSASDAGQGGHFENMSDTGTTYGVWASNNSTDGGAGVYGEGVINGVWGRCTSDVGYGVYADGTDQDSVALGAITTTSGNATWAGYFHGGVTGCIRLSSSGTIDNTHSGNGGLVFQNSDNLGNPNWKITRSSTNLFFHYGDNEQIHLTNGNHIHIPNGGITLEWTAPSALPNWEISRSFGDLTFYYDNNLRMLLESDGDLEIDGVLRSPAADFAEMMRFRENIRELEPGDVVCINKENNNTLQKTDRPYLTNIAGVISEKPAVLGNQFLKEFGAQEETNEDHNLLIDEENNALPVAIVGIVKTKVSCENGEIKPGDLLTTSSTPGYAMKATSIGEINGYPIYPQGCIIGRALESLKEGKGKILVLVSLM